MLIRIQVYVPFWKFSPLSCLMSFYRRLTNGFIFFETPKVRNPTELRSATNICLKIDVSTLINIMCCSDGPNEKIQAVIDVGVYRRLVELLVNPQFKIITPALRTVGSICTGDDVQTQVCLNHYCYHDRSHSVRLPFSGSTHAQHIPTPTLSLLRNPLAYHPPTILIISVEQTRIKPAIFQAYL